MVRPYMYDCFGIDNYPLGTNAIIAVISHTVKGMLIIIAMVH